MEQHLQQQEHDLVGGAAASSGGGGERLPQWSPAETREFIFIRTELDQRFVETKRNKRLWEAISSRMLTKGFYRTPEQCKSKWKNLLTRFKGSEVMGEERSGQTFPYYDEMRNILSGRERRLLSVEKKKGALLSHQEEEDEMQEEDDGARTKKKKKRKRAKNEGKGGGEKLLEEVAWALKELARRQKDRQVRLLQIAEAREAERQGAEMEWRKMMELIFQQRAEMEKRWRQREEEWRARQETRAERRDTIISAIFARLGGNDSS